MAALIGMIVGGFFAVAVISAIVERFAFRDMEPTKRAEFTVGSAFILASLLAGFGMADGGPFVWTAVVVYLPGAIVVFALYRKRYAGAWVKEEEQLAAD